MPMTRKPNKTMVTTPLRAPRPLPRRYVSNTGKQTKKYIIGFIVGLVTVTTLTFAVDYSDID